MFIIHRNIIKIIKSNNSLTNFVKCFGFKSSYNSCDKEKKLH